MTPDEASIMARNRIPTLVLVTCLIVVPLLACKSLPVAPSIDGVSDLDRLQGHWQGRGPGGPCTVIISGETLRYEQPTSGDDEFWYDTTIALRDGTDPRQIAARIVDNDSQDHLGTVVVILYELGDDAQTLNLGIVNSFEESPPSHIQGDWDRVIDFYELAKVRD